MVKLVKNKENKIPVRVTSLISYAGFSASLEVDGISKEIPNLDSPNAKVVFSADEVASLGEAAFGTLTVKDAEGKQYMVYKIYFYPVDSEGLAQGFQKISITIVSLLKYEGSRRGGEDSETGDAVQRKIDATIEAEVEPRLVELEVEMGNKVSVEYDESDTEIEFKTRGDSDESEA